MHQYSPHWTKNPAFPLAASHMRSLAVRLVISTINWMMWRGVRNWALVPAVAGLPSICSYISLSYHCLALEPHQVGQRLWKEVQLSGIVKRASFIFPAYLLPSSSSSCRKRNTRSPKGEHLSRTFDYFYDSNKDRSIIDLLDFYLSEKFFAQFSTFYKLFLSSRDCIHPIDGWD